jgi:hypothetical protein
MYAILIPTRNEPTVVVPVLLIASGFLICLPSRLLVNTDHDTQ